MGRRKDLFRPELIAALQIVQNGDIAPDRMRSSWAGALGQPQFLPSLYLKYAVDFDRDGRRDIWASAPDSLASIANYLRGEGWKAERGWGLQASVPASSSCTLEGPSRASRWPSGRASASPGERPAAAGQGRPPRISAHARRPFGPAFIVKNFYTLKESNYSDLYALYVGHLADRMAADKPFIGRSQRSAASAAATSRACRMIWSRRATTSARSMASSVPDAIAVGLWQVKKGQAPTCFPDAKLVRSIH